MNGSILVKVAQADGQQVASHEVKSVASRHTGVVTVQAVAGQHIQLLDSRTGLAPQKVASARKGDDLVLAFDADNAAAPDLVVKDFYAFQEKDDSQGFHVYGDGEIGQLTAQGVEAALQSAVLAALPDDQAGLILAQNDANKAAAVPTAEAAGGLSSMQIAGLVGLGVVAAAAGGGGGGGSSTPAAAPAPAPVVQAPSAPSVVATSTASAGKVLVSGTTNDADPTFTGTGTAGNTVNLYVDGVKVGTSTVAADGTFSLTPSSALADGSHSVTYTFANAGGESTASPAATIVIDTTAPTAVAAITGATDNVGVTQGTVANGGTTDDTTPTLTGTITGTLGAGEVVAVYHNAVKVGEATVSGSSWSFTEGTALADGATPSYTVAVVDAVGQSSAASSAFTLTVDTHAPTTTAAIASLTDNVGAVTGTLTTGSTTDDTTPSLAGTISGALGSGETVGIYVDGTYVSDAVVSGTNWSWTPGSALSAAAHSITAAVHSVSDVAGAASTAFLVTVAGSGTSGGTGADVLTGDATNNLISGGAGDDQLFGGVGDDTLIGGAGADVLDGGPVGGIDTASYADATAAVTLNLTISDGSANTGDALGDTFIEIDQIIGSSFGDTIIGYGLQANVIHGGAGNDTITGGIDDDYLDGGAGADALDGGGGFVNYAVYQSAVGDITVDLTTPANNTGEAAGDTYTNINGIIAGSGNDHLVGSANYDYLAGGMGDDTLTGGANGDSFVVRMISGDGHDTVTDFNGGGGTPDRLLITNVLDVGAAGYTTADFTAAGFTLTAGAVGADGEVRIHSIADGADASLDTVVTFTGAAATFTGGADALLLSGIIQAQSAGI